MNNAYAGTGGTAEDTLDGFHAALVVSVVAAALGIVAMAWRPRTAEAPRRVDEPIVEALEEAA